MTIMRLAGIVFDIYDDPTGDVLREKVASSGLPDAWADASLLPQEKLDTLPDRLFAFVATNGDDTLRKYAMHDAMHVGTSILYFLDRRDSIPAPLHQKIASNLVNACGWYDLEPPEELVKVAILNAALTAYDAVNTVGAERKRHRSDMANFRAAQASGTKVSAGRTVELTRDEDVSIQKGNPGRGVTDLFSQFSDRERTHAKIDAQMEEADHIEPHIGAKRADLQGTSAMPASVNPRKSPGSRELITSKTAAWEHCGDISRLEIRPTKMAQAATHFALPHLGLYPIETPAQIKQAETYFAEHVRSFDPEVRRVFASQVWERALETGTKIAGSVLDYAGAGYGPVFEAELISRRNAFDGTPHEAAYAVLWEKRASMPPEVMAAVLVDVDQATGAARAYGAPLGFLDPYAAVFGSAKVAAFAPDPNETFSWAEGGDYVAGPALMNLAKRNSGLDATFGAGFQKTFQSDPVGVFKSLPDPQKVVLSRLARQTS